jgi:hypothetical protein
MFNVTDSRQGHRRARRGRFLRGQEKKIAIVGGTPAVTFPPARRTDAPARAPLFIPTEPNADGALAACFVVVGANGVVPSM